MKKILSLIVTLTVMLPMPLQAANVKTSIESYSQGKQISGSVQGEEVVLSDDLKGMMIATNDGLEFVGNNDFKISLAHSVESFTVVDDCNNDGFKDVAVSLKVNSGYNNFLVVSSKDSKILYETKLTHKTTDDYANVVTKNSVIRQVLNKDGIVYLIYDHHLLGIDISKQELIFDHQEEDNLWKMVIVDEQIIFTNQLGELVSIDKNSGKENYRQQLAATRKIKNSYSEKVENVNLNLWDLLVKDEKLYVSSEEDKIYQVDINSGVVSKELELGVIKAEDLDKRLEKQSSYNYSSDGYTIFPTGVFSKAFNSYKMKLVKDNLMLVEAYLGDQGYQNIVMFENANKGIVPAVLLVDLDKMKVVSKIKLEQYNLEASNAMYSTYQGQEVIVVLSNVNKETLRVSVYSTDGKLIVQNRLRNLGLNLDNVKVSLSHYGENYLLQINGGSTFVLDADLKTIHSLGSSKLVNRIADVEDGMFVTSNQNGKINEISKLGWNGKDDLLMSVKVPDSYLNNGFEAIKYDESNKQILSLVNEVDQQGEIIASHIVIINLDGTIVSDKKVLLTEGYDENNRYFKQYVIGNEVSYFIDLNKDGKKEILVDTNIIDGKNFNYCASYQQTVEESGTVIVAGDLNKDGIDDLVNVGEKEMRVYHSLQNGYEISYQKTNIVKKYEENLLNAQHVKVIGDLAHQGINLFAINARNEEGCQYYQVIDPRDLSVRFKLMPEGIFDWGESYSLMNRDLNHDNIDDLIFNGPENKWEIISGKDGSVISEIMIENSDDYSNPQPTVIDEIIPLNLNDSDMSLYQLVDLNEDGIEELGYIYFDYDSENTAKLKIINGQDLKELKICELDGIRLSDFNLIPIQGTNKIILKDTTINQIYDYQNGVLVAGLDIEAKYARGLNDGRILIESTTGELFIFNDNLDFSLVDFEKVESNNGNIKVKFKSDKTGMMSVYDQGNLIAKTIEQEVELKLLPGVHRLIFSYDDGQGKVTHITKEVTVTKSGMLRFVTIFISALLVLGIMLLGYYPKYRLYKKAGVKNGKNN